jgi:rhamnosyltransferase
MTGNNRYEYAKSLAGVVVVYNPDDSVEGNIRSYLPFLDRLYIIDNSKPDNRSLPGDLLSDVKVHYVFKDMNTGVSAALNEAAGLAIGEGFSWLMTMDQDSSFENGQLEAYAEAFKSFSSIPGIAVAGVQHDAGHINLQEVEKWNHTNAVITSGSLVRLSTWEEIGGFDAKLFIDEVDHEYCYRSIVHGYDVIILSSVAIKHNLGKTRKAGYLSVMSSRGRILHSPKRVYFMVRNYLYVKHKYGKLFREEFRRRDRQVLVSLKNNLFFNGHFLETLSNIFQGYIDYKRNNFTRTI